MKKMHVASALAATLAFAPPAPAHPSTEATADVSFIAVGDQLTLRRLVVGRPDAKATILLLHGFPETMHAWSDVARALAVEFEVHAFDWPGFGQSSRPAADRFSYAPHAYAQVLRAYVEKAGIDRSRLTIYATDIGALPVLLAALEEPAIARRIIVGDFAPFDRPELMYDSLRSLKSSATAEATRVHMNRNRDEILENVFWRGLPATARFEVPQPFKDDMARGWDAGALTSADAFYHYYRHFTQDQRAFEANLSRLRTPVRIVWGEHDIYIDKAMGVDLATRIGADLTVLKGVGHYPHLQAPERTVEEIRSTVR